MKSRARVLVVDDEQLMRRMIRSILVKEGYSVTQSPDGDDALFRLEKAKFDIVITDVNMPGCNGFELLSVIREAHPEIGVIVMTGFGDSTTPDRARALGADEYITKPFNAREIQVIVERVCWRRLVARRSALEESAAIRAGVLSGADPPHLEAAVSD